MNYTEVLVYDVERDRDMFWRFPGLLDEKSIRQLFKRRNTKARIIAIAWLTSDEPDFPVGEST